MEIALWLECRFGESSPSKIRTLHTPGSRVEDMYVSKTVHVKWTGLIQLFLLSERGFKPWAEMKSLVRGHLAANIRKRWPSLYLSLALDPSVFLFPLEEEKVSSGERDYQRNNEEKMHLENDNLSPLSLETVQSIGDRILLSMYESEKAYGHWQGHRTKVCDIHPEEPDLAMYTEGCAAKWKTSSSLPHTESFG